MTSQTKRRTGDDSEVCRRGYNPFDDSDDLDDFEEWETYTELVEQEDYPALVRYCEERVRRFPRDPYSAYYLGDAYVQNGEYEKALAFIAPHHRRMPDHEDYHHVILDALFALGRTEDDFAWVERPSVYRLNHEVLDACYRHLAGKRGGQSSWDLHWDLFGWHYTTFSEDDLVNALRGDPRFIVEDVEDWKSPRLWARRPRAARRAPRRSTEPGKAGGE